MEFASNGEFYEELGNRDVIIKAFNCFLAEKSYNDFKSEVYSYSCNKDNDLSKMYDEVKISLFKISNDECLNYNQKCFIKNVYINLIKLKPYLCNDEIPCTKIFSRDCELSIYVPPENRIVCINNNISITLD